MNATDYQKLALRTAHTPRFTDGANNYLDKLIHAALGLATETGEFQDAIKKHLMYGKPLDAINVMEEIGDCLWYLALAADATGFSLSYCMERNIAKLRERYPEKFTSEQANTRDLDAERKALEEK